MEREDAAVKGFPSSPPATPAPRSAAELEEVLARHGLLDDPDGLEEMLRSFLALRVETLTVREIEILRFASEGMTTEQTAQWLEISRETVRTHRMNAMRKLNIHTLTGAVGIAFRAGVIK